MVRFDALSGPLSAQPEDFVLAPSPRLLAYLPAGENAENLAYDLATLERIGDKASALRWLEGERASLPNALIVPLPRAERAALGDVVLTVFGSGLTRALVVRGGEPDSPRVRLLDTFLDEPVDIAESERVLAKGRFRVLKTPGEPGTTLACRVGSTAFAYIALGGVAATRAGLGFAGRAEVLALERCTALPIVPEVKSGQRVYVPVAGEFRSALVTRVEPEHGRVFVKGEFAGQMLERAVGYTNVASELASERPAH